MRIKRKNKILRELQVLKDGTGKSNNTKIVGEGETGQLEKRRLC